MQGFNRAAVDQINTSNSRAIEICFLQARAVFQIDCNGQLRTVSNVNVFQKRGVTHIDGSQVCIGIGCRSIPDFKVFKSCRFGEITLIRIEHRQVAHIGNHIRRVDPCLHFGYATLGNIVEVDRIVCRCPLQRDCGAASETDSNIQVNGRSDGKPSAVKQSDVDDVAGGIAGHILAVHITEAVKQPPFSLLGFTSLQHRQITVRPDQLPRALVDSNRIDQRHDVLGIGILVKDSFRPLGLMLLIHGLQRSIRPCSVGTQIPVHRGNLRTE